LAIGCVLCLGLQSVGREAVDGMPQACSHVRVGIEAVFF
jgi:hypothetical protein